MVEDIGVCSCGVGSRFVREIVDSVDAKFWSNPKDAAERAKLYDALEKQTKIDLASGLRQLTNAEDGFISLKPMTRVQLKIRFSISPIYRGDKWGGFTLHRWATAVSNFT